jgi:hypothetical protein
MRPFYNCLAIIGLTYLVADKITEVGCRQRGVVARTYPVIILIKGLRELIKSIDNVQLSFIKAIWYQFLAQFTNLGI